MMQNVNTATNLGTFKLNFIYFYSEIKINEGVSNVDQDETEAVRYDFPLISEKGIEYDKKTCSYFLKKTFYCKTEEL